MLPEELLILLIDAGQARTVFSPTNVVCEIITCEMGQNSKQEKQAKSY